MSFKTQIVAVCAKHNRKLFYRRVKQNGTGFWICPVYGCDIRVKSLSSTPYRNKIDVTVKNVKYRRTA